MTRRQFWLGVVLTVMVAVASVAVGFATELWVIGALSGFVVVAGVAMWRLQYRPRVLKVPSSLAVAPRPPSWLVDRPDEVDEIVAALVHRGGGAVGITTGLQGAGGFGKTTLAKVVCGHPRIRRRFRGRVHWVTIGRDARGPAAIAAKLNGVINAVGTGENAMFTDPDLAAPRLGVLLDQRPRRLLVLDDVWFPEQLDPFLRGGKRCARLVTTRNSTIPAAGTTVKVDQMTPTQAQELLTWQLPQRLDAETVEHLLAVTGRWPLLLRLANKILTSAAEPASVVAVQLSEQLRLGGPQVIDGLTGEAGRVLDVNDVYQRERAVQATLEASASLLTANERARFAELAVFAEDEAVPVQLVARLWQATGGMQPLAAGSLVTRLDGLALVSVANATVSLHDVVRDVLGHQLGEQQLTYLHQVLLDATAERLPQTAGPADDDGRSGVTCWWQLDEQDPYLWEHLIEHLIAAGRRVEAEAVAADLRWVAARLVRFGPTAAYLDLSLPGTPRTTRLCATLVQAAHLLTPTVPPVAVVDVLHSRVAHDPRLGTPGQGTA